MKKPLLEVAYEMAAGLSTHPIRGTELRLLRQLLPRLSKIKGLFEGFKQFCSVVGVDSEHLLKTIPLKDCCHDLDILLATDIELGMQYAAQTKDYFLEHWNF